MNKEIVYKETKEFKLVLIIIFIFGCFFNYQGRTPMIVLLMSLGALYRGARRIEQEVDKI